MRIEALLENTLYKAVATLYDAEPAPGQVQVQKTRTDFDGDYTIVVFPLLKLSKQSPEKTAKELGQYFIDHTDEVVDFNAIKGFLNLSLSDDFWVSVLNQVLKAENPGYQETDENAQEVVVEFSSPNTNKPLHLGHIRNNLLGDSITRILKAAGYKAHKVQIVNDRGIHISKTMLAWQKWSDGETPDDTGEKGDHFVGRYYVMFDAALKKQMQELTSKGLTKDQAMQQAPLMKEARELLKQWENGREEAVKLWKRMNAWVYKGFDKTYNKLGITFDKSYYESQTYKEGRETVLKALQNGIFYKKADESVWCDLSDHQMDEKLLLRGDGTTVYITQDLGLAIQRQKEFNFNQHIYVVGNEQEHHFKVLSLLLKKLGYSWADKLYHLSYGMVELPHGKMKSREGTVVDADDLIDEMLKTARETARDVGRIKDMNDEDSARILWTVALGALKYFILKVDPKKNMLFNPDESIDFNGNTGPSIQYSYARIQSVIRKAGDAGYVVPGETILPGRMENQEVALVSEMYHFEKIIEEAAQNHNPSLIANYVYNLSKLFNQFYRDHSILHADTQEHIKFRLALSSSVGKTIASACALLGIDVPEIM